MLQEKCFQCLLMANQKNSHCFKNIKYLPCQYVARKKSCRNTQMFVHCVRKFDRKFRVNERKIALIFDSCTAHSSIFNLANIQLVFLPSNTTSVFQPMEEDVIRSLKAHYRGRVVVLHQFVIPVPT